MLHIPKLTHAAVVSCVLATPVESQSPRVAMASRIRVDLVTTERSLLGRPLSQSVAGTLVDHREGVLALVVSPGVDTVRIPESLVREVHVSRGVPARWRAALTSAVVPGLLAGVLNWLSLERDRRPGDPTPLTGGWRAAASAGGIAALAAAVRPRERWARVWRAPEATSGPKVIENGLLPPSLPLGGMREILP